MIYQSPPELGALYTEVEEMMKEMGKEQQVLLLKKIRAEEVQAKRRAARLKQLQHETVIGVGIVIIIMFYGFMMMLVAQMRQEMYPQYGNEFIPKTEEQRKRESQPQVYVGR